MMQQRQRGNKSSSRLLLIHQAFVIVLSCIVTSNIFCTVTAWTPPADTLRRRHSSSNNNMSPLFSTVDKLYYSPATSTPSTNGVFESTTTSSEEMEIAAQNYGCGTINGGNSSSSRGGQQKITLTRWLQAKVQDYPEVCWWLVLCVIEGCMHMLCGLCNDVNMYITWLECYYSCYEF